MRFVVNFVTMSYYLLHSYFIVSTYWSVANSQNFYFWIDLQKDTTNGTYWDHNEISISPTLITSSVITGFTNNQPWKLAFDACNGNALTPVSVLSTYSVEATLCEISGVGSCPCRWISVGGGLCYQFQASFKIWPPNACTGGGTIANHYFDIQNRWTTIQQAHPLKCGYNNFRVNVNAWQTDFCFTYPPSTGSYDWETAEQSCLNVPGGPYHLATFYDSTAMFNIFQTLYQNMIKSCNFGHIWMGYNSYARNALYYDTTNYKSPYSSWPLLSTLNGGASATCVSFDDNNLNLYASNCQNNKNALCLKDSPRAGNCPAGWIYIGPYCYMILDQQYSFNSGQSVCQTNYSASNLASFHTQDQWDDFNAYRAAQVNIEHPLSNILEDMYIGYTSITGTPPFQYVDKSDPSWSYGFNPPSTGLPNPSCAVSSLSNDYKWTAQDCILPRAIVCMGPVKSTCTNPAYTRVDTQCYMYLNSSLMTWDQASRACNQNGGTLPIISNYVSSGDSQTTVWKYFQIWRQSFPSSQPQNNIWIGLTQSNANFALLWMDRQNYNPAKDNFLWASGYPDTLNPYVLSDKANNYGWTTVSAATTAHVICHLQKPLVCPTVDFYEVGIPPTYTNYTCYLPNPNPATFGDGEDFCRSKYLSAHLIQYQTNADWNLFQPLFNIFLAMKYPVWVSWIGYSRGPQSNNGPWVSNQFGSPDAVVPPAVPSMWASGEPNTAVTDGNSYGVVRATSGSWITDISTNLHGVMCEFDTNNKFCLPDWGEFYGSGITTCYKAFPSANFATAAQTCQSNGGFLPSFHSLAEWQDFQRYRWTLINTNHASNATDVWLGLSDGNGNLNWTWLDGSNYNWSYWQPNAQPQPVTYNPNVAYSRASVDINNMYWHSSDPTVTLGVICQIRQYALTNPCVGNFSLVGNRCFMPVTWEKQTFTHDVAQMFCAMNGYSLPSFPSSQTWIDFMNWFTNMNQAVQWSPLAIQKSWPMQSFWIGLMEDSSGQYLWDDSSVYSFYDFTAAYPPTSACYYADSNSSINFSWTKASCTSVSVPTLICEDHSSRMRCPNGYFLSQNNICYWTNTTTKMDVIMARAYCQSYGNGFLPSFHNWFEWSSFVNDVNTWTSLTGMDTTAGVWIGLNDQNTSFLWQWDNNMNYNWTIWKLYVEPSSDVTKQCVSAVDIGNGTLQWQRTACNSQLAVLCQSRPLAVSSCLPGYSDINGDGQHCYQTVPRNLYSSLTYERALFYCQQTLNGTLPYFATASEWNDFLSWTTNFGVSANLQTSDFWLGYSADSSFQWSCIDNTVTNPFYSWMSSMPNQTDPMYCAASLQSSSYNWSNFDCTTKTLNSLICKQKITPSICPDNTWIQMGSTDPTCYSFSASVPKGNGATARATCQSKNSSLPSFHSQQEHNDFLNFYVWYATGQFSMDTSSGILIGLSDTKKPFLWQWDDISSYNWNNWDIGIEPSADLTKRCIVSTRNSSGNFVWRRSSCSSTTVFVCQLRVPQLTTICSPGWSDIGGSCFRLWPGIKNANWNTMKYFCNFNGAQLPSFTSAAQWQQFLDWKTNTARGRNYQSSSFCINCCQSGPPPMSSFGNWSIDPSVQATPFCAAALVEQSYSWSTYDCTYNTTITSAICMESFPPSTSTGTCAAPWFYDSISQTCYLQLSSSQPATFNDSVTLCNSYNGTLPAFHTNVGWHLDDFIATRWYFDANENLNPISSSSIWTGLTDVNQELVYQYVNGDNFNWALWNPGQQPQNDSTLNCVTASGLGSGPGYWSSASCSSKNTVFCQQSSLNDPCGIPGWSSIGNRCYRIVPFNPSINFFDANTTCNKLNATLPSFDNVPQWNQFLQWRANFANGKMFSTTDFWLGAQYDNVSLQWSWTDSQVTSFAGWNAWYLGGQPAVRQCVASSAALNASWVGLNCFKTLPSLICQLIQYAVDCQMTDWVNGSCADTCGNSTLQSTRTIAQINLNGGQPCSNETLIIYDCLDLIPCPIDCQVSTWKQWSDCDCGASTYGKRARTRTILVDVQYGGQTCPTLMDSGSCPELSCWPMTEAERIASMILHNFGCVWLLSACGLTFASCLVFRIFTLERMLHAGQEICIIITHILILFLREDVADKPVCTAVATFVQFGTIGTFAFMAMEAIQMYCYVTNVISQGNFLSWKWNLFFALVPTTVITSLSSAAFHYFYPARYSCWLNIGNRVSAGTVVPVMVCSLVTIVSLEAAGMGDFRRLPDTDRKKRSFNLVNQRGLLFILPLNIGSWLSGLLATYYQHIALFTLVFSMFMLLGIAIFIFHALSHGVLYLFYGKIMQKIAAKCPCCKKKPSDSLESTGNQQPLSGKEIVPNETAVTVGLCGAQNDSNADNNELNCCNNPGPSLKDLEAFYKWVSDGRDDNMRQSKQLLF